MSNNGVTLLQAWKATGTAESAEDARDQLREGVAARPDPRGRFAAAPFVESLAANPIPRATCTAVYAVANPDTVPQALLHNLKHNQVLHQQNIILTVEYDGAPWVANEERVDVKPLVPGFWQVRVHYGFKDTPDIPQALSLCSSAGSWSICSRPATS